MPRGGVRAPPSTSTIPSPSAAGSATCASSSGCRSARSPGPAARPDTCRGSSAASACPRSPSWPTWPTSWVSRSRTSAVATSARGSRRRASSISSWPPGWVTSPRRTMCAERSTTLAGSATGGRRAGCSRCSPISRPRPRRDAEVVRLCEQAIEAAPVPAPSRARPALHEALGRAYAGLGQMSRSIEVLRAAFDEARAEPGDPGSPCGSACCSQAPYIDAGLPDEAYRTLDVIKGERDVLSDPVTHARLEWAISRAYAEHGQADLAERYARRVVSALAYGEHLLLLGRSHMLLGSILLDRSRRAEADAELDRATDVLERGGAPKPELALLDYERGRAALLDGRLDDAETLARAGLDRTEATEPGTAGMLYTLLAKIALAARRPRRGPAAVQRGRRSPSRNGRRALPRRRLADARRRRGARRRPAGRARSAAPRHRRAAAGAQDLAGHPCAGWTITPGHARPLVDAPQPVLDPRVPPSSERCSARIRWNRSSSSSRSQRPYFRNGKAAQSAARIRRRTGGRGRRASPRTT